jgi:hypothetical protein
MKILLVQPDFPLSFKSKNHKDFLPVGLLKLASYYRKRNYEVKLVYGKKCFENFKPEIVGITSLFTYWSRYVWETVNFYKEEYPEAKIVVGGIYASLMPDHCKLSGCDRVFVGVHKEAEKCKPAYDLVDANYQIIHTSRGCIRRCEFCGTWKIEPRFIPKKSIKREICSNKIIFYDNNFLANPNREKILNELSEATHKGKAVYSEFQCGIDGRLLTSRLARMIKEARMINPRIAWDHNYDDWKNIKKQLDTLADAGYNYKNMYIFMIYNWNNPIKEMEKKRLKCWKWGVQIADCRYRPLNQTFDNYNPKKKQTNDDYYIHPSWTDDEVKLFRKNVRKQNICVRMGFKFYSRGLERKRMDKKLSLKIRKMSYENAKKLLPDIWSPGKAHCK